VVSSLKRYGKSLTAHLDDLGLLGPDFTVAHGVWLDDEDCKRLGDHGASVAHNPGSNMRLGSGLADARGMLNRSVNLGIGTDGASCSDNLNMYESMRLASMVSKVQGPDQRQWLSTEEIVIAATEGSAQVLGWKDIGRIAPGFKADIVFLDLSAINWIPCNDPTNQLVHTEDGSSVKHVMIGGRMVVRDGVPVNVDMANLAKMAEAARSRLAKVNRPGKKLFDRLERIVGSYCPGLALTPHHIHRYGASTRA
jgi:guanine deaminase